ncbi:MAG TPA: DNA (cytosine-5-)-methyltransferase [Thermoanaerobaculia bacterium]|nr:DNA (cytosine-5-)-methyltransferase [Thermoanaerobaculia bacterium]
MRSVELFAGCGSLAFGLAEAGFEHALVVEKDPQASSTLALNKDSGVRHFSKWNVASRDVRSIDYARIRGEIDLVSGGPPCQPFSIGGKHKGPSDTRNMWPEAIRAVRELQPRAFVFENVRGLLRPAFANYLEYLRLQLTWPEIEDQGYGWRAHHRILRRHTASGAPPRYRVIIHGINAADYGAPQKRHRAIVLGFRVDVASEVAFPKPTHSRDALVWTQRVSTSYWDRHGLKGGARPAMSEADRWILEALAARGVEPVEVPWMTVRDAISDLPMPLTCTEQVANHLLHPGARVYKRHTGSSWDEPAKALKAGDHGVPGGENLIVDLHGAVRYFTIREMARLQGLPDDFVIGAGWKGPIKQLGNAVPVQVGQAFGRAIMSVLEHAPYNPTQGVCSSSRSKSAALLALRDSSWPEATLRGVS